MGIIIVLIAVALVVTFAVRNNITQGSNNSLHNH